MPAKNKRFHHLRARTGFCGPQIGATRPEPPSAGRRGVCALSRCTGLKGRSSQPDAGATVRSPLQNADVGNQRKVILSCALWQELYGSDQSVIGKDLRIYGNPHTIVGVMPGDFFFLDPKVRLWRPLAFTAEQKQAYHSNSWEMIGRLKPGATLQQAQLDALNRANLEKLPALKPLLLNAGFHTEVHPLQDELVRGIKGTLYLLWGGVLFVLLIGAVGKRMWKPDSPRDSGKDVGRRQSLWWRQKLFRSIRANPRASASNNFSLQLFRHCDS